MQRKTCLFNYPASSYLFSTRKLLFIFSKLIGFEATVWITALFFLAIFNNPGEPHFSICPLNNMGFDFCPGCGLGTSISYFFQGEIGRSINSHPLGLFALSVIFFRIYSILKLNWSQYGKHITTNALS